jgi:hypothetical protein
MFESCRAHFSVLVRGRLLPMDEMQRLGERMRNLARGKPTPGRRAEVEACLEHKWEGIQVQAARVLGAWGGPESAAALRRWLERLYGRPYAWAARGVAARALARCVGDADVGWVLDLYFELDRPSLQYELLPLVSALPRGPALARLRREARGADGGRRPAATRALRRIGALDASAR